MKTKEEQLKIYSAYLPYKLKVNDPNSPIVRELTYKGYWYRSSEDDTVFISLDEIIECGNKPFLYPLDMLTQEIEHEGERFVPIDYFEITDDHTSYNIEFDRGNIRLIKDLINIAKHNTTFDIKFIPFEVVNKLIEWHFNVFNISEDKFINKATLNHKS